MAADDSVYVFKVDVAVRDRVTVTGDVWTPGDQGFSPGMRLSDAIKLAGGVKPDAYLGDVLIARVRPDSTRMQLRTSLRDTTGVPTEDVILEDHDDVRIFALHEMRPRQYVAITGAVRKGRRGRTGRGRRPQGSRDRSRPGKSGRWRDRGDHAGAIGFLGGTGRAPTVRQRADLPRSELDAAAHCGRHRRGQISRALYLDDQE
jgi:hypothetical protein